MSVFYPSLVANLKLTFDDTLTVTVPGFSPEAPVSVEDLLSNGSSLPARPTVQPLVSAKGPVSYVLNRVPVTGSVDLPGHRPAGNFHLVFPYKDLPIDPRTVKACAVDIYLGTVTPDGFSEGMGGAAPFGVKASVLDTSGFFGTSVSPQLLLTGMVDEWEVDHGEDGSTIAIGGRDFRGLLIDTPIATNPAKSNQILDNLKLEQPIQLVIRDLLATHPMMAGIKVRVSLAEWPGGIPPAPGGAAMGRNRRGAKGKKVGGRATGAGGQGQLKYWDVIVKLCFLVGAIPAFVGSELRIRPSRSLYDQQQAGFDPENPTPFAGGLPRAVDAVSASAIAPIRVRKMVYGRDIDTMTFARKFGGYRKPRQICCVSIDTSASARAAARMIKGLYPSSAVAARSFADGVKSMADTLYVPVADITDVGRLESMAQAIYEEMSRGEITGSCETPNLASFGGDNSDPDLLRLRPGDAVEFVTDVRALTKASPLVSTLTNHMRTPFETAVSALKERLGDENLARVILATSRGLINEVQGFFRVEAAHYTWGEEGLKVSFDFQNFVEKTFDKRGSISKTGGPVQTLIVPAQQRIGAT